MKLSAVFTGINYKNEIYTDIVQSRFGDFCIGASDKGLRFVKLINMDIPEIQPNQHTDNAKSQLISYFNGEIHHFNVDYDLDDYPSFTKKVWQKLAEIPYGQTISYMQLAVKMGDPKCIRAVGTANGRNPIPIIIPCHRVIGSNGSLTGYALGLDLKKKLLILENPEKIKVVQSTLF